MDHMDCKTSKLYCPNSFCKLSFKSRSIKQLTWTCDLAKKVDVLMAQITLYYRYRSGYKQFLIDVNIDHCAYHRNVLGSATLDLVQDIFKNYTTNIWQSCPLLPGNVSVNNLPLIASLVQNIFVPAGDYKLTVNSRVNKEKTSILLLSIFLNIPAGRTLEDDKMG